MEALVNHLRLLLLAESAGEPVKTFVQTITGSRASSLDVPLAAHFLKTESLGDLLHLQGMGEVLLIRKYKNNSIPKLIFREHLVEFFLSHVQTLLIVGIDHEDNSLRVLVVMPPKRADFVLTSDVPDSEVDVLVFNRLDIEADGRDRCDDLTELQLVEDGGFSGCVQSHHENSHLLIPKHPLPEVAKCESHGCVEYASSSAPPWFSGLPRRNG
mmetsp:Transcript_6977/g.13780  ORF Transcript_6977/g.13780 Transcript_6977/m.13780 type:complete len:213 (+) Transcript_6977:154-792(+)